MAKSEDILITIVMICLVLQWALGFVIYVYCLILAYPEGTTAVLLTLIFPFLGQLYWIVSEFHATGTVFNLLTIMSVIWVITFPAKMLSRMSD